MKPRERTPVRSTSRNRGRSSAECGSFLGPCVAFAALRAASRFLLVASLLVLASSCATEALWSKPDAVYDPETDTFLLEPPADDTSDLLVKIALTPFAVAIDLCIVPIVVLSVLDVDPFGDDDDFDFDKNDDCD